MFAFLPASLVFFQISLACFSWFKAARKGIVLGGSVLVSVGCFLLAGSVFQEAWYFSVNTLLYVIVGAAHLFYIGFALQARGSGLWRVASILQPLLALLITLAWRLPIVALGHKGTIIMHTSLQWHIALAAVAYAALTLAAFFAFAILTRQAYLKAQKRSSFLDRLPPLDVLEKSQNGALVASFIALLAAISVGSVYIQEVKGVWFLFEAKTLLTLVSLFLVAWLLFWRQAYGAHGPAGARVVLLVYGLIIVSFLLVFPFA